MSMFTVDDNCIRCGLCAELCVADIIHFERGEKPWVPPEEEADCIRCGQCVSFCPKVCCYLSFQDERIPVDPETIPHAHPLEFFLRSRRSIRRYKREPVAEGLVRRVLETARYAPSASNSQPVRWIVSMTRAKTLEIAAAVFDHFRKAAADDPLNERLRWVAASAERADEEDDLIFRGAPQLAIALVDSSYYFPEDGALALTYFELAAHANRLGCCWAGFFTLAARKSPEILRLIGAGEDEMVVGAQMFGYVDQGRSRMLPPRKQVDVTLI